MADNVEAIYAQALKLLGREGESQAEEALRAMCAAAGEELSARLRQGVDAAGLGERFTQAAGVLALSMYIQLGDAAGEASSYKVGNISVSRRSADGVTSSAAALRRQAELMLSAYLRDNGFSFRGV